MIQHRHLSTSPCTLPQKLLSVELPVPGTYRMIEDSV
jgi:hypothetical protein